MSIELTKQFCRGNHDEELLTKLWLVEVKDEHIVPEFPILFSLVRKEKAKCTEWKLWHRKNLKAWSSMLAVRVIEGDKCESAGSLSVSAVDSSEWKQMQAKLAHMEKVLESRQGGEKPSGQAREQVPGRGMTQVQQQLVKLEKQEGESLVACFLLLQVRRGLALGYRVQKPTK